MLYAISAGLLNQDTPDPKIVYGIITDSLMVADNKIKRAGEHTRGLLGMGTTIVLALFIKKSEHKPDMSQPQQMVFIANVGDSSAYLVSERKNITKIQSKGDGESDFFYSKLLTKDNLLAGTIKGFKNNSPSLLNFDENVHSINLQIVGFLGNYSTRSLSKITKNRNNQFIFLNHYQMNKDDYLLLSSDGLTNMLNEDQICNIVSQCERNLMDKKKNLNHLEYICKSLVQDTFSRGGFDDISVVLIKET